MNSSFQITLKPKHIVAIFLCSFVFLNCDSTKKISAQDISKDPYMTFDNPMHDFGTIKVGENVKHIFKFTNTGKEDITLELVSGCDCTDLEWPEMKTFKPGESGTITATFISSREEERGPLDKTIDILLTNVDPSTGYQIIKEAKYKVNLVE